MASSSKRKRVSNADADYAEVSSDKSPTKAKRSKKDEKGAVEKRLGRYRSSCPQNILDRVYRVMSQRFFMVQRSGMAGLREEFKVLGSTGNVYTVTIAHVPSCDCPDALKGNHCKHILFVFLKVLGVPQNSTHYYQKALLSEELEQIFASAPAAPNEATNARVKAAYEAVAGGGSKSKEEEPADDGRRMPTEDDDCPICYEAMADDAEKKDALTWCHSCGNALHTQCFQQWAKTAHALTCVFCRAPWKTNKASGSGATVEGGYLNLGGAAGLSPVRDTTTYYHGPRRGYGYQYYD